MMCKSNLAFNASKGAEDIKKQNLKALLREISIWKGFYQKKKGHKSITEREK